MIACDSPLGLAFTPDRSVTIERFAITGCQVGLQVQGPGCDTCILVLRDGVVLDGQDAPFATSVRILGTWAEVRISNVTVETAGPFAIEIAAADVMVLESIHATGGGIPGAGIMAGRLGRPATTFDLSGSSFEGFGVGTYAIGTGFRIRDAVFDGNQVGLALVGTGVSLDRVQVRNSSVVGLLLADDPVLGVPTPARLQSVVLAQNAVGLNATYVAAVEATDLEVRGNGVGIRLQAPTTGFVRASAFEGNALAFDSGAHIFDARDNWWGAPSGPTLAGPASVLGEGDPVTPGVLFMPFRTQP